MPILSSTLTVVVSTRSRPWTTDGHHREPLPYIDLVQTPCLKDGFSWLCGCARRSSSVARHRTRRAANRRVQLNASCRPGHPRLGPFRPMAIHRYTHRPLGSFPFGVLSVPPHHLHRLTPVGNSLRPARPPPGRPRTRLISVRRQRQCLKPRGSRQPTMSDSAPGVRCLLTNPALPRVTSSMSVRAGAEMGTTPTPSIHGGAAERYCSRIRSAMGLSSALHGRSTLEDRCIRKNARGRDGRM